MLFLTFFSIFMVGHRPCLLAQQNARTTIVMYDSIPDPQKAHLALRGLEQDESGGFKPFHALWNIVSYVPKKIIYGIQYASGYSVRLINNQKFIDTVEDFL